MNISIFDVVGPIMVGPSSSHTAGAARLARVAGAIAANSFDHVSFGLNGSFAKTYRGHGTDKALVAGVLGLREYDESLSDSFNVARERGLSYDFYEVELDGLHENSVVMTFSMSGSVICEVAASSLGGGRVTIRRIDGFDVEFDAMLPTLIILQRDQRGVVSEVTRILAESGLNIGVMKLSRRAKGDVAFCVIETDDHISASVAEKIEAVSEVLSVRVIDLESKGAEDV